MAFAVTAWKAYATPIDQSVIKRFDHTVEMYITNLAADVDADIGDTTTPGQFFTDAEADVTYGATATALKNYLNSLYPKVSHCQGIFSEVLDADYDRVSGAPALANEYQVVTFTNHIPEIAFAAASAPTSWKLSMHFGLKTSEQPLVDTKYGTGI